MELTEFFNENPKAAIAFSGGVDSSYLLYAAVSAGAEVIAYYVKSAFQPQFELEDAKIGMIGDIPEPDGIGTIVVATGGTSDIPVAEEAALTAEFHGNKVTRLYDVGVAGLHRLLSYDDEIMSASVVIAIAGMEGALASVIGGLVDCPVIAVPTSVV